MINIPRRARAVAPAAPKAPERYTTGQPVGNQFFGIGTVTGPPIELADGLYYPVEFHGDTEPIQGKFFAADLVKMNPEDLTDERTSNL